MVGVVGELVGVEIIFYHVELWILLSVLDFHTKFNSNRTNVGKLSIWAGLSRDGWMGWLGGKVGGKPTPTYLNSKFLL